MGIIYCHSTLKQGMLYVRVKAPLHVCTENTVRGVCVERLILHEVKLSAVFASRHSPSTVFFVHTSKAVL